MNTNDINLEESIGYLATRASKVIGKFLSQEFQSTGFDMPIEHWATLLTIFQKEGITQQEIANTVFKDKGTVARAVKLLEKNNIIVRIPDDNDKRIKRIYLTHKGKHLLPKLQPHVESMKKIVLKDIPEEHLAICKQVLQKIYHNLT